MSITLNLSLMLEQYLFAKSNLFCIHSMRFEENKFKWMPFFANSMRWPIGEMLL